MINLATTPFKEEVVRPVLILLIFFGMFLEEAVAVDSEAFLKTFLEAVAHQEVLRVQGAQT